MILGDIAGFGPFKFGILQHRKKAGNLAFGKVTTLLFSIHFDRIDHLTNTLFLA